MEPVTLLLILIASICLYYFLVRKSSYFERLKVPHVSPIPILGNMAPFIFQRTTITEHIQKLYNMFPNAKYFGLYDFTCPTYVIRDPDLLSKIAIKEFDNFCDHRNMIDETIDPIGSRNLFFLKGDQWREMRKHLTPSFTSSKMKMMFELMTHVSENFINLVTTQAGKTGKTYDMKDLLGRYATDIVATCAFGISVDSFKHPKNEFFMIGQEITNFNSKQMFKMIMYKLCPMFAKVFKIKMFGSNAENFFKDIVSNTVKIREEQKIVRPDLIQLMMETKNKDSGSVFDINEMTAQAVIFFLAGFDGISLTMCFVAHLLGVNPDVQSKLREEIDNVVIQTNGKPTYETITRMKYLDAIINETLRLYSPAPYIDRICIKETELPAATSDGKPITLKPGDCVAFPIYPLHHDPNYFPQPDKFDPERFLNGHVNNSVYLPFGIGPRVCIGNRFALMEVKVMLFYLLWHCDIEPDVKTAIPLVMSKKSFVSFPSKGFWLKLKTRKSEIPDIQSNGYTVEGQ